jgi:hypothetical protein
MLDALQFEGPLARFTLRPWGADMGSARPHAERIRYADEHEALTMLRGAVDPHMLPQLRTFLLELGAPSESLADDPRSLLWLVARRIVGGQLVLEREPIMPMISEVAEHAQADAPFHPPVNEINEGVGLHLAVLAQAEQATLVFQAKQAAALQIASAEGAAFCEVCSGASAVRVPSEPASRRLASQASQAQALQAASASAAPFCEVCANCQQPQISDSPAPPTPEPPPSPLARQANQAQALRDASATGTPFCEQCNC